MMTFVHAKPLALQRPLAAFVPLILLPILAGWFAQTMPPWMQMWVVAFSVYAGFKWATFALCRDRAAGGHG
jgi:hypothetical protein